MPNNWKQALLLTMAITTLSLRTCSCATISPSSQCPDSTPDGIEVSMTPREFLSVYASIFHMSDGSSLNINDDLDDLPLSSFMNNTLSSIRTMASNIGVNVQAHSTLQICGSDAIAKLVLLAIVGNFAARVGQDPNLSPSTLTRPITGVVIDVHTGALVKVDQFDAVRSYFLEALLIISIIAIGRLALVRSALSSEEQELIKRARSNTGAVDILGIDDPTKEKQP